MVVWPPTEKVTGWCWLLTRHCKVTASLPLPRPDYSNRARYPSTTPRLWHRHSLVKKIQASFISFCPLASNRPIYVCTPTEDVSNIERQKRKVMALKKTVLFYSPLHYSILCDDFQEWLFRKSCPIICNWTNPSISSLEQDWRSLLVRLSTGEQQYSAHMTGIPFCWAEFLSVCNHLIPIPLSFSNRCHPVRLLDDITTQTLRCRFFYHDIDTTIHLWRLPLLGEAVARYTKQRDDIKSSI